MSFLTQPQIVNLSFCAILIAIAVGDFKTHRIDNRLILALIGLALFRMLIGGAGFGQQLLPVALALAFLALGKLLAGLLKRPSLGAGDYKLIIALALYFNCDQLVDMLVVAFTSAAIYVIILMALKRIKTTEVVAFGPFLALASAVVLLFDSVKVM